jgi:hypothetical protein
MTFARYRTNADRNRNRESLLEALQQRLLDKTYDRRLAKARRHRPRALRLRTFIRAKPTEAHGK